jgi:hypothetical protein
VTHDRVLTRHSRALSPLACLPYAYGAPLAGFTFRLKFRTGDPRDSDADVGRGTWDNQEISLCAAPRLRDSID